MLGTAWLLTAMDFMNGLIMKQDTFPNYIDLITRFKQIQELKIASGLPRDTWPLLQKLCSPIELENAATGYAH